MLYSTLCYLERGDEYLMLHRVKKVHDVNQGKWIGVGGKFQDGESPEDCVLRECLEETGLTLTDYRYRGIVTFVSDQAPTEYMHLFTASAWTGTAHPCDEGVLQWIKKADLLSAFTRSSPVYSVSGRFTPARSARSFKASGKVKLSYSITNVMAFPPAPQPKQ